MEDSKDAPCLHFVLILPHYTISCMCNKQKILSNPLPDKTKDHLRGVKNAKEGKLWFAYLVRTMEEMFADLSANAL